MAKKDLHQKPNRPPRKKKKTNKLKSYQRREEWKPKAKSQKPKAKSQNASSILHEQTVKLDNTWK